MRKLALVFGLIASLMLASVAAAHPVNLRDGNDTRGRLDVRKVTKRFTTRPRWIIKTGPRWTARELWDQGYFIVSFDTRGDGPNWEYFVLIRSTGNRMVGNLWRDRRRARDVRKGPVKVFRPSRDSVSFRFSLRRLDIPTRRTYYRWLLRSLYSTRKCRRVCIDRVPDNGAIREPLGVPN